MKQVFRVHGMSCMGCVKSLEKILLSETTLKQVTVRLNPPELEIVAPILTTASALNQLLVESKFTVQEKKWHHSITASIRRFLPLLTMTLLVVIFTGVHVWYYGWSFHTVMQFMMAGYFLLFGALKVANWQKFVVSYRAYDDLAKRSAVYAQTYPALEVAIGVLYYVGVVWWPLHLLVGLLMTQKAYSTWRVVRSGNVVQCACLGGFFAIPITRVTVFEDILMAAMAFYMMGHWIL